LSNIGKITPSSFLEDDAIYTVQSVLQRHKNIKCYFSSNDRTPNIDGFFTVVGNNGVPIKNFQVQIKHITNVLKNEKTGKYHISFDTKFFNYLREKITFDTGFFFYVDEKNTIYFAYIDDSFIDSNRDIIVNQNDMTIKLDTNNILTDLNDFYIKVYNESIRLKSQFPIKSYNQKREFDIAIKGLNKVFDEDFLYIKKYYFPPDTINLGLAHSNHEGSEQFGIFPILAGRSEPHLKEFDGMESYMYSNHTIFTANFEVNDIKDDLSPTGIVNKAIDTVVEQFFKTNILPTEYLSIEILSDNIYSFIDSMVRRGLLNGDNNSAFYNKEIISLKEIEDLILPLFSYFSYIIRSNSLEGNEKIAQRLFINGINGYFGRNLIVDMISTYIPNRMKSYDHKDINENQMYLLHHDDLLVYLSFKELTKRNVIDIKRQFKLPSPQEWHKELEEHLLINMKRIYELSLKSYKQFVDMAIPNSKTFYLTGSKGVYWYHKEFEDNNMFGVSVKYFTYSNKNRIGYILSDEESVFEQMEKAEEDKIVSRGWGVCNDFLINNRYILYNTVRTLLKQRIHDIYGFFNDSNALHLTTKHPNKENRENSKIREVLNKIE